jgi:hypothetical protein
VIAKIETCPQNDDLRYRTVQRMVCSSRQKKDEGPPVIEESPETFQTFQTNAATSAMPAGTTAMYRVSSLPMLTPRAVNSLAPGSYTQDR